MEINETRRNNHNKKKYSREKKTTKNQFTNERENEIPIKPNAPSSKYVSHFLRLFLMPPVDSRSVTM